MFSSVLIHLYNNQNEVYLVFKSSQWYMTHMFDDEEFELIRSEEITDDRVIRSGGQLVLMNEQDSICE